MTSRMRALTAPVVIFLCAAILGTIAVSSLLSRHAASVLVESWRDADEASVERLLWRQQRGRQMQMLSSSPKPLGSYSDDCGSGGSRRLCELGVNVGDANSGNHGDASIVSDELEDSYNLFGISPARETAGNTIGGDWFG
eukprot:CAMPEP_0172186300 /NCGR_PEP_ID=MMETSP1050-20130122/20676_1 /TAXON_ID=233186 /ORGANISM="Cryptomonas curvata, Strain CCAP979/52" /LENGTH=139 /DNA_ID=CAMNT_0012860437 /DNA_START=6 /DNA_END=422 /DNA_ORIENTATION=-